MKHDIELRDWLIRFLKGGVAYMPFDEAVYDFPIQHINTKPPKVDYTFWHILEHIRITQWDILDFCRNKNYKYIKWPNDYWPAKDAKATKEDWGNTIKSITKDTKSMIQLIEDPKNNLHKPFAWGEGQNLLREAMLVANHNAYHTGEFAILRQVTGSWGSRK